MKQFFFVTLLICLIAGCSRYKPTVIQGNAMTETTVEQIKPGISKADVLLLLGTPLMQDDFQGKRWDYLYYTVENGQRSEQKSLTVIFDGNTVASVK